MASKVEADFKKKGLELLLSQPVVAVSLFFMWLCGIALTYILIGTNTKFSKHRKATESCWFRLTMGFLPCAIIIILYHAFVFKCMPN